MFEIIANKNKLHVIRREPVASGSVNIHQARFQFSEDWDGLEKTAVFRAGDEIISLRPDSSGACVIPWEVKARGGWRLEAGCYGTRDGETVLTTTWADLGMVLEGVPIQADSLPPTSSPAYGIGHGLKIVDGNLTADTVDDFSGDNTLPMTAAGIQAILGRIEDQLRAV